MKDLYLPTRDNFSITRSIKSDLIVEGKVKDPFITIFIPTYKRVDFLLETIESARNQEGSCNYEIVIVSNDPESKNGIIRQTIEEYEDDRIYYYVNQTNIGSTANWNRGIELSRGTYVTMIHDDDVLSPWFLQAVCNAIEDRSYPEIIGVSAQTFDSCDMPLFRPIQKVKYRTVTKTSLFMGKYLNVAGITIKHDYIVKMGGYSEDYDPIIDTALIYITLLHGQVVNIEHCLSGYRVEGNGSQNENQMSKIIHEVECMRRSIATHELFPKIWMKIFDKEYLYSYIEGANKYWGLDINYKDIINEFGFSSDRINMSKLRIMSLCQRGYNLLGRISK